MTPTSLLQTHHTLRERKAKLDRLDHAYIVVQAQVRSIPPDSSKYVKGGCQACTPLPDRSARFCSQKRWRFLIPAASDDRYTEFLEILALYDDAASLQCTAT